MQKINPTPHDEGYQARMWGRPIKANPYVYPYPFKEFCKWSDGWWEADEKLKKERV
jgi:hypothetical protein